MNMRILAPAAMVLAGALPSALLAQGIVTEQLIDAITVLGDRDRVAIESPAATASKTAEELRAQNLVNPEDALRYMPNLTIRKRYIGDRNALIGGRSYSTLQAPRGLVFMDGYLLSNFLGRFDAPRWNMIAPEEIERVDVLYGPYSAIYPGNSIGTTVAVRTRRPDDLQLSLRTTAFSERFSEYGLKDDYSGHQLSAFFGDRFDSGAWLTLSANRQDSTSHPMQYFTVSSNAAGQFPVPQSASTTPIAVTGVRFDTDPLGNRRAVFGANAGAIDHTIQQQWKLRGGYAVTDSLEAEGFIAGWSNDSDNGNRTFMRDSAGNPVWQGRVNADGIVFDVPSSAFAPSTREEKHVLWGGALRSTRDSGWNGSLVFSRYDIREDFTLQANAPDSVAAAGKPGTTTERDGTGWKTFEVQGVYAPIAGDWTDGAHTIAIGYHRNDYQLENPVYETADWRARAGQLAQDVHGETSLQALYAQDAWQLTERWILTLGVRYEAWQASDGFQFVRGLPTEIYPQRSERAWSPKASVSFAPDADWSLRLSAGRGVRFPTVAELFLGTVTSTQITRNDPNLQAEVSDSIDFTFERRFERGNARVSFFQDDVRDTIWNQVNIFVFPSSNTVQNIGRVRTRGVESAFALEQLGIDTLSLQGSVAYAESEILENDNNPAYVGNVWPRIPKWRANLQAVWRPAQSWLTSVGARYSGRMFNRLENDDIHPDTYGGVSRFTMFDARVSYTTPKGIELALGVDNIADERAYQSHPYPGRTGFFEARWSFEATP
jgi:iron complex outermembrane recepter protein